MNKRGEDLLMKQIIVLIIVFALFASFLFFVITRASGELVKKEIIAKQLCIMTIGAKPGTTINITSKLEINKVNEGISVKKYNYDVPYVYPCESQNFEIEKIGENTIITIKKYEKLGITAS